MNEGDLITRLLGTAADDAGCEATFARLAEYVEGELAQHNVDQLLPAVGEHLRNCPACEEDHDGVVALLRSE